MPTNEVTEDQFLGALLGMAIGDAMGMPVVGWSAARIRERLGRIEGYHRKVLPDGAEIQAGEFTDESEIALCIVEAVTSNAGNLDPDTIGARMLFLARGESRRWMAPDTLRALNAAEETLDFMAPLDEDGPATGDVAARGIPIGLLHALGRFQPDRLRADAETVTRLTHGSPAAIAATVAVAYGVNLAARGDIARADWAKATADFLGAGAVAEALTAAAHAVGVPDSQPQPSALIDAVGTTEEAHAVVASAFIAAMTATRFEDVVETAVNAGGATDSRGAIAGALAGAASGSTGIPQRLIDDLGSRIYVSLAAPWFHKIALRRAGIVINLEMRE